MIVKEKNDKIADITCEEVMFSQDKILYFSFRSLNIEEVNLTKRNLEFANFSYCLCSVLSYRQNNELLKEVGLF